MELPRFAHLPMLVNEKRQKLSKRRDPVAVESYREKGFLPEAMRNYLALLGWSHPEGREVVPIEEIVEHFRIEDVNHAPAFFDVAKLSHMNGEYLRAMTTEEFVEAARPWLEGTEPAPQPPWSAENYVAESFRKLAPLVQERVATLGEVPGMVDFVFLEGDAFEERFDQKSWEAVSAYEGSRTLLASALEAFGALRDWTAPKLHETLLAVGEAAGSKLAKAQMPVRVAITGRRVGPPLFESLELLGRERTLDRIRRALARLG
jgi:glutamyl-tRNA synthetase